MLRIALCARDNTWRHRRSIRPLPSFSMQLPCRLMPLRSSFSALRKEAISSSSQSSSCFLPPSLISWCSRRRASSSTVMVSGLGCTSEAFFSRLSLATASSPPICAMAPPQAVEEASNDYAANVDKLSKSPAFFFFFFISSLDNRTLAPAVAGVLRNVLGAFISFSPPADSTAGRGIACECPPSLAQKARKGTMMEGRGFNRMTPGEARRATAALEECLEKLSFLGSMTPDVLQHRDELSRFVGDEISRILLEQRDLESRYENLIAQRSALKGLANKRKYKEVGPHPQRVGSATRELLPWI
eukprot:scaffold1954_cov268-Pinguiococcus_pyrenoidosus.AAC.153